MNNINEVSKSAVSKAVSIAGGQTALHELSGVSQAGISKLARGINTITGETSIKFEKALDGQMSRQDFRPDLYLDEQETLISNEA